MRKILSRTKKICALLLILSFFLPMSRGCSKLTFPISSNNGKGEATKPWIEAKIDNPETYYPWEIVFNNEGFFVLFLLSYFWPLPFLWLLERIQSRVKKFLLIIMELVVATLAWTLIYTIAGFSGIILYGGYISLSAIGIYFLSSLLVIAFMLMELYQKNNAPE